MEKAGSIYAEGIVPFVLSNVTIKNCRSRIGILIINEISSINVNMVNITLDGNIAESSACLLANDVNITITGLSIINNVATSTNLIEMLTTYMNSQLIIGNCLFQNNTAKVSMFNLEKSYLEINTGSFSNNTAGQAYFLLINT